MSLLEERFWAKVDQDGPLNPQDGTPCWLWTACLNYYGYGKLSVANGRWVLAHRFSYELLVGPIPEDRELDHRHTCAKRCVQPVHLRLVTPEQNNQNHAGAYSNSKSGVLGVSWDKQCKKWLVQAQYRGVKHFGGYFADMEEAKGAVIALRNRLYTHNDADREAVDV
jgi:HNH endonuclease